MKRKTRNDPDDDDDDDDRPATPEEIRRLFARNPKVRQVWNSLNIPEKPYSRYSSKFEKCGGDKQGRVIVVMQFPGPWTGMYGRSGFTWQKGVEPQHLYGYEVMLSPSRRAFETYMADSRKNPRQSYQARQESFVKALFKTFSIEEAKAYARKVYTQMLKSRTHARPTLRRDPGSPSTQKRRF